MCRCILRQDCFSLGFFLFIDTDILDRYFTLVYASTLALAYFADKVLFLGLPVD